MRLNIKVYLDYICPFCFLITFSFNAAIKNKDVSVEYIPFEIPELKLENDLFRKNFWSNILENTAKNFGHKAKIPDIHRPKSKFASEAYYFADENGKGKEFNSKVYEAFFEKGKDINRIDVLSEVGSEIGIDSDDIKSVLEARKYKEQHEKAIKRGKEEGINAVPTIIIGHTKVVGYKRREFFDSIIEEEIERLK